MGCQLFLYHINYSHVRIRNLRIRQGYTIEQLAEQADISPKFLYEIERGKKGFSSNVLYRLAKALNVGCDFILEEHKPEVSDYLIELVDKLDRKEQTAVEHILLEIIKLRKMS